MLKQGRTKLAILMGQHVRCVWDYEVGEWYYSVVDVIGVLNGSTNPRRAWSDIKRRYLKNSQNDTRRELYAKCVRFNLDSKDGCKRLTDTLSASALSELFDFVPRARVAKFRQWVGSKKYGAKDKALHRQLWKEVL
jgi:hypothetical protein